MGRVLSCVESRWPLLSFSALLCESLLTFRSLAVALYHWRKRTRPKVALCFHFLVLGFAFVESPLEMCYLYAQNAAAILFTMPKDKKCSKDLRIRRSYNRPIKSCLMLSSNFSTGSSYPYIYIYQALIMYPYTIQHILNFPRWTNRVFF